VGPLKGVLLPHPTALAAAVAKEHAAQRSGTRKIALPLGAGGFDQKGGS